MRIGAPRWPIDLAGYGHAATPILAGTQVVHGKLLQSLSSDAPQD